ncbi:MAG: XRE family transcriptional regulator [Bacteroidia bacterium]
MSRQFFLNNNVKFLRTRLKQSQQQLSDNLGIKRTQLASYELGNTTPTLEPLMQMADFFKLTIDTLLNIDLSRLGELQLRQLESGEDVYISGGKLRVMATTVNNDNKENIELVPIKARAGYTAGYNDPEFIKKLPVFQLPFLSQDRSYRAFQIEGDSMLPIKSGTYIIGEFVQDWDGIKDGDACIILTENDGAVFKIIYNQIRKKQNLLLKSLNPLFPPYEVKIGEVKEIWKFKYYFTNEMPDELSTNEMLLYRLTGIDEKLGKIK